MKITTILTEVAEIAKTFLLKHYGLDNGYNTYITGSVSINNYGSLKVEVDNDNLTKHDINVLSKELEKKIQNYMKKKKFTDTLYFESYHVEYGCYKTNVSHKTICSII